MNSWPRAGDRALATIVDIVAYMSSRKHLVGHAAEGTKTGGYKPSVIKEYCNMC
jgi:hypothetical protein